MSRRLLLLFVAVAALCVTTTAKSNDNNDDDDSVDKDKYWIYEMLTKLFGDKVNRDTIPDWVDKGWKAYKGQDEFHHHYMLVEFSIIETDVEKFTESSADFSNSLATVISELYHFESVQAQVLGNTESGDDGIKVLVLVQYTTNDETEDCEIELEKCSKSLDENYNIQDVGRLDSEQNDMRKMDEFFYYLMMQQDQNNQGQVDLNSLIIYLASQENDMDNMMKCILMSQMKGNGEQSQRKDDDKWMQMMMMMAMLNPNLNIDLDKLMQLFYNKNDNNDDDKDNMWFYMMQMMQMMNQGQRKNDDMIWILTLLSNNQAANVDTNELVQCLMREDDDGDNKWYYYLMTQQNGRAEDGEVQRKENDFLKYFFLLQSQGQGEISEDILPLLLFLGDDKEDDLIYLLFFFQNQQNRRSEDGDLQVQHEDGQVQRKDNDFLEFFILMQLQDGQSQMSDNCLLPLLFLGDDKMDEDVLFLLLTQLTQNQQQQGRSEDGEVVQRKDNDMMKILLYQQLMGGQGQMSENPYNLLFLLGDDGKFDENIMFYMMSMNQKQQQSNGRSEDGEVQRKDNDFLKFFLIQQMQGGQNQVSENCMNLLLLLGDDDFDEDFLMILTLLQSQQQQGRSEDGEVVQRKDNDMMMLMMMMSMMKPNQNNNGGNNYNFDTMMDSMMNYAMQTGEEPPPWMMNMWLMQALQSQMDYNNKDRDQRKDDDLFLYFLLFNQQNQTGFADCDPLLILLALDDKQDDDFLLFYFLTQQNQQRLDLSQIAELSGVDENAFQRGKDNDWVQCIIQLMMDSDGKIDWNDWDVINTCFDGEKRGFLRGFDAKNAKTHSTGTVVGVVFAVVILAVLGIVAAAMVVYIRRARKHRDYQNVPLIQNESEERRGLMAWSSKTQAKRENLVI